MAATDPPPVMEARRWLQGVTFPPDRPLINVSQAAPVDMPPLGLRQALADAALNNPDAHLYGPVLGLPALRAEIAQQWSASLRRHHRANPGRDHPRLQPGLLRRHVHPCRRGG